MKKIIFLMALFLTLAISGCEGGSDSDSNAEQLTNTPDTSINDESIRGLWKIQQDSAEQDSCDNRAYLEFSHGTVKKYDYLDDGCDNVDKPSQCYYSVYDHKIKMQSLGKLVYESEDILGLYRLDYEVKYQVSEDNSTFTGTMTTNTNALVSYFNDRSENTPLILSKVDANSITEIGSRCDDIKQLPEAQNALDSMLKKSVSGESFYSHWCYKNYLSAVTLYAVTDYKILQVDSEYFDKNDGVVKTDYLVRISSSTKGGFPIRKEWVIGLSPSISSSDSNWCIESLSEK